MELRMIKPVDSLRYKMACVPSETQASVSAQSDQNP